MYSELRCIPPATWIRVYGKKMDARSRFKFANIIRSLGMCAGLIHDVPSCEELAKTLEKDAEAAFDKTSSMRVSRARL